MKRLSVISLIYIIIISESFGQTKREVERDTVYFDQFIGRERFSLIETDLSQVKEGRYSFNSGLLFQPVSNKVNQLQILGNFLKGKYDGVWEYSLSELEYSINELKGSQVLSLDYSLDGIERKARFSYKNGVPDGEWKIYNSLITNNRKARESSGASFVFKDGLATGNFTFVGVVSNSSISGKLNDEGFLDGIITITYEVDGDPVKEIRNYENGFLTILEVFSGSNLKERIVFDDVVEKLKESKNSSDEINFTISDEGFGVIFQNGYPEGDEKLMIQENGTRVFERVLGRYQRFASNDSAAREVPKFNFTRRFKFIYPSQESEIIKNVRPTLSILVDEYNSFLSNPKFILNRTSIDSMAYIFGYIDHARRKAERMLDVIELTENGYFDFLFRPNYYPSGLIGLNRPDSFIFDEQGKEIEANFDLGVYVDDPQNLIYQIEKVTEVLKLKTDRLLEKAFLSIKIFDEASTIDSLDNLIVQLRTRVDALYSFQQVIPQGRTFEQMDLDYRLLRILDNNVLNKLQTDYIAAQEYTEKYTLGVRLTCILETLEFRHDFILEIENMSKRLDGKFTRFSPNPFFERDIETKILPSIYGKGTGPLLNSYIDNLYGSKTCRELRSNLEKIEQLEKRLEDFASRSNEEEVVRMDRALRRENLPSRIERLINP